jgi:hypothetical protein
LTTVIKVDGTLSSNGQGGSGRTGGGSGGSILITTSLFDGTGSIEVFFLSHLLFSMTILTLFLYQLHSCSFFTTGLSWRLPDEFRILNFDGKQLDFVLKEI